MKTDKNEAVKKNLL